MLLRAYMCVLLELWAKFKLGGQVKVETVAHGDAMVQAVCSDSNFSISTFAQVPWAGSQKHLIVANKPPVFKTMNRRFCDDRMLL